ncbi:MAG TPA: hypothetical protein VMT24_09945 [Aggregatilineaceae bacterium]|nr:hypothetical protein [Aggregatilineaceae bacterium]
MNTNRAQLDALLKSKGVAVEPEVLVEPEIEAPDKPKGKGKPTRLTAFRERLGRYGNRVLGSATYFFVTFWHMLVNVATALAGSIVLLPIVILVRGLAVLLSTVFSLAKSTVLSLFRAIFDVLSVPVRVLNDLFHGFNKRVLYPLLKAIREEDTAAVVALVVMMIVIVGAYFIATRLIH